MVAGLHPLKRLRHSIVTRLSLIMGLVLFASILVQMTFHMLYQERRYINDMTLSGNLLGNTIKLGTHYAMMTNSREDINRIIQKVGQQKEIVRLRIYSKSGDIKYSNRPGEIDRHTDIHSATCAICHHVSPPLSDVPLDQRRRIMIDPQGHRLLGITSPIYNEPSCSTTSCHVHPADEKVLGILDVVVSMKKIDSELILFRTVTIVFTTILFLLAVLGIHTAIARLVKRPIGKLIAGTQSISRGDYSIPIDIENKNEIGMLATAINHMRLEIGKKQNELNRQRDEYQKMFEVVPCYITIQDRDFRLRAFNRKFASRFNPSLDDACFSVYKGRTEKCEDCPVERTFQDGKVHFSEESWGARDGTVTHWLVTTSPIRDEAGNIVAAMEMSLDVTPTKQLEDRLHRTEKKYQDIFNNIPNPVFVLKRADLTIMDCNESVRALYGYAPDDIIGWPFAELFCPEDAVACMKRIRVHMVLDQVRHRTREGTLRIVNIRLSPTGIPEEGVLLAVISDITARVEAEQQLVQAGKMATLGEMATGVAHELNQPLSVIKTASNFFMRKLRRNEPLDGEVLLTMSEEIDSHVDRATRIINHMREFGRKTTAIPEPVQVNEVIRRAFDIFSQQLKLWEIEVAWDLDEALPPIQSDPGRLEQVFINLLINARDAIQDRDQREVLTRGDKAILLRSWQETGSICVEVADTGGGIPESLREKIFEPFFTTKEVGKGTGLGLSISYGIIRDCGGQIRALPRKPIGTRMEIRFPIPEAGNDA